MTERNDSLVADYLARVSRATAGLPADRRDELARDLREHIEASRADLPAETEAEVRGILDRLGDPAVIARAAAEEAGLSVAPAAVDGRSPRRLRLWLVATIVGVVVLLVLVAVFLTRDSQGGAAMIAGF
ncbi:HAAS signaling domain-containing protein [Lentzea sp. NPDC004789]